MTIRNAPVKRPRLPEAAREQFSNHCDMEKGLAFFVIHICPVTQLRRGNVTEWLTCQVHILDGRGSTLVFGIEPEQRKKVVLEELISHGPMDATVRLKCTLETITDEPGERSISIKFPDNISCFDNVAFYDHLIAMTSMKADTLLIRFITSDTVLLIYSDPRNRCG
ncbi:unnamed protein product [Protopolystoma xenopodis]|uniref:Uncharacterized protein n=1 Tax=Protopolystoma xenopodis TaxID=117903 RepID=A0A448WG70_9PLAT|nr:unnamed protein product [Protopolystoma xenopodis]